MWGYRISLNPDMYHGANQKPPFLKDGTIRSSVRMRASVTRSSRCDLGANGHAFIQVLNGSTGASTYHTFPLEDFWASKDTFEIRIGPNQFNRDGINLQIDDNQSQVIGELHFEGVTPGPSRSPAQGSWVVRLGAVDGMLSRCGQP